MSGTSFDPGLSEVSRNGPPSPLRGYGATDFAVSMARRDEAHPKGERSLAERVGFEPTCRLRDKTLSRRPRYDHFGTSPFFGARGRRFAAVRAVRSARALKLAPTD